MSEAIKCRKCGGLRVVRNGRINKYQKYLCRECSAVFSSKPKKYSDDIKIKAIEMYLNNTGIRKIALFLKVSPPLVLKWIKAQSKILANSLRDGANTLENGSGPDIIELDEIYTFIKKNSKGRSYGLLILDGRVVLLRTTLVKD
jgi:hypothetical protein